jgi:hypothetical protein
MTHTPGPWRAFFSERNQRTKIGDWYLVCADDNGEFHRVVPFKGVRQSNAKAAANAALIATAPELLEMLAGVADGIKHAREATTWSADQRQAFLNGLEDAARAVITKVAQ